MTNLHGVLSDLALTGADLERAAWRRADPALLARLVADPRTAVLEVVGDRLLVEAVAADAAHLALVRRSPCAVDATAVDASRRPVVDPDGAFAIFLGEVRGVEQVVIVRAPTSPGGDDGADGQEQTWPRLMGLRECGRRLDVADRSVAATAVALANWHMAHLRCPRCGAPTRPASSGWTRRCIEDASEHFPRTDPAVIMSVIDDEDRLLLGNNPRWPATQFSVLAGFVEPGESFELTVAREVFEEVGVRVRDVRYLGSQPWPFPASVMVGFTARAESTELALDPAEIARAIWVTREEYRAMLVSKEIRVPSGISIAKRIIEHWLGHPVDAVLV